MANGNWRTISAQLFKKTSNFMNFQLYVSTNFLAIISKNNKILKQNSA